MRLFGKVSQPRLIVVPDPPVGSLRLPQTPLVLDAGQTRVVRNTVPGLSRNGNQAISPPLERNLPTPGTVVQPPPVKVLQATAMVVPPGNLLVPLAGPVQPPKTMPVVAPEPQVHQTQAEPAGPRDMVSNERPPQAACDRTFGDPEGAVLLQPSTVEALAGLDTEWSPDANRAVVNELFATHGQPKRDPPHSA